MSAQPQPPLPPYEEEESSYEPLRPGPSRRASLVRWIAGGIAILTLLLMVAAAVLLRSPSFHSYVLRVAQQKMSDALGSQVQVSNYALRWSGFSPTVDVFGIVVQGGIVVRGIAAHGTGPSSNPPLLRVDHVGVEVRITSLLRRTWYLNDLHIDHPVVQLFVDAQGRSNLPEAKGTGQKGQPDIFDLGVRHVVLNRGEIYVNDRKRVLDADLHELNFQSSFSGMQRSYSGALAYHDGHLQMGSFRPLTHDLETHFTATEQAFTIDHAVLTLGHSKIGLDAQLADYAHPRVSAKYDGVLDSGEFRSVLKNPSLPVGLIHTAGTVQYANQPGAAQGNLLNDLSVSGELSSQAMSMITPNLREKIQNVAARYLLVNGNLQIHDARARILGGQFTGTMTIEDVAGAARSNLKAGVQGISLADLAANIDFASKTRSSALRQIALRGTANVDAEASWSKNLQNLLARGDATIEAAVAPVAARAGGSAVPLKGVVHARYVGATQQLSLTQSSLRTPQTTVLLDGTMSNRSALQVRLQSGDLHELEVLRDVFSPSAPAAPLGLYGTASFVGSVHGSTAMPEVAGQLTASNLRWKGSAWRLLRADIDASPSAISLEAGELQPMDRGRITFHVRSELHQWSFNENSSLQATLNASQINVADLIKMTGSNVPAMGSLTADLSVTGTELSPVGHGTLKLGQGTIAGQPIKSANISFEGTGSEVHGTLAAQTPAGAADAKLIYYPKQQGYDLQLQANGIKLDQLEAVKERKLPLAGTLNISAKGRGTLRNPELQATVQAAKLSLSNQEVGGLMLQASVANRVARFSLAAQVAHTPILGQGSVELAGDYKANAALDTQAIPLAPLVAAYAPSQVGNITGQTEIHATLRGPLKNKSLLEAHITIPQLTANYKSAVQLGAVGPIKVDYLNGLLTLQRGTIRGTGTDLQFQGLFPTDSNASASLLLLGTVDLRLGQLFDPDITSAGQLRFNIDSSGRRSDPNVQGKIEVVNASFATGAAPVGLQNGNGVLELTKDRLNISQFSGTVGGGEVKASGGILYRPSLQFDLALSGNGIRILYPGGVRAGLDANLALTGSADAAMLRGQVRVDQVSFTRDFDLMNFIGELTGDSSPPPTQGFSQNLRLDIGVQSSGLNLVSRTLSVQGAANLRAQGTAAQPVILGRVNLNGGDLIFMGNRYVLQGGTLDFVNPSRTQPLVNVAVNTSVQQYDIQMRIWGPADQLHTSYSSDPALPPSDIVNLIAFGKTSEGSSASGASAPGNLGAESLIASQVSSQVTNRVEKIAGISQLSIDPVLGGSQQNPGARIAIQQRVTSKIFVTFASDVTSTQRQVIRLEYQATPRVSVNIVRDENGGFAFDTRIRKTW